MVATSKTSQQLANFRLAVSAAKYVNADLGPATGLNLAPNGQSEIRQVDYALKLDRNFSKLHARQKGSASQT